MGSKVEGVYSTEGSSTEGSSAGYRTLPMDLVPSSGHPHLSRMKSFVLIKLGKSPAQFQGAIFHPRSGSLRLEGLGLHPLPLLPRFPGMQTYGSCDPTRQLKL